MVSLQEFLVPSCCLGAVWRTPLGRACWTKSGNLCEQGTNSSCAGASCYETSRTTAPCFGIQTIPAVLGFPSYQKPRIGWKRWKSPVFKETCKRPNTKWVFNKAVSVDLKAILARQPLRIDLGRLPAWLRNKREVTALDQYEDALCIFRCIAVHQGARPDRNSRRTRQLAQSFLAAYPKLCPPIAMNKLYWVEQHFKQGIAAYTVTPAGDFVLSHTPAHYYKVGHKQSHKQLHLWRMRRPVHPCSQLSAPRQDIFTRGNQVRLPRQSDPRARVGLRKGLLPRKQFRVQGSLLVEARDKAAGHPHTPPQMWLRG